MALVAKGKHVVDAASRSGGGQGSSGRGWPRRRWWIVAALAAYGMSTGAAILQPLPLSPEEGTGPFSPGWWLQPRERNAYKRLPVVLGEVNELRSVPDSDHLWAVGERGLILHSADGGRTWYRRTVFRAAGDEGGEDLGSPDFVRALKAWHPVIYQHTGPTEQLEQATPRSVKRFLNRVRFYAMRVRAPGRPRSLPDALWAGASWLWRKVRGVTITGTRSRLKGYLAAIARGPQAEVAPSDQRFPEDLLVALSAIRERKREWLDRDELWADFGAFLSREKKEFPASFAQPLQEIVDQWRDITGYRERFEALLATVRVRQPAAVRALPSPPVGDVPG